MDVHSETKMFDIIAVHVRLFIMAMIMTFFVSYALISMLRSLGTDPGVAWFIAIWPSYFCGEKTWEFFDT